MIPQIPSSQEARSTDNEHCAWPLSTLKWLHTPPLCQGQGERGPAICHCNPAKAALLKQVGSGAAHCGPFPCEKPKSRQQLPCPASAILLPVFFPCSPWCPMCCPGCALSLCASGPAGLSLRQTDRWGPGPYTSEHTHARAFITGLLLSLANWH
jgi:hypothetical protein